MAITNIILYNIPMDKKTRIFFGILTIATIVSVFFTFHRAFVSKDYDLIPVQEEVFE